MKKINKVRIPEVKGLVKQEKRIAKASRSKNSNRKK
jgi:hypothetical protein